MPSRPAPPPPSTAATCRADGRLAHLVSSRPDPISDVSGRFATALRPQTRRQGHDVQTARPSPVSLPLCLGPDQDGPG